MLPVWWPRVACVYCGARCAPRKALATGAPIADAISRFARTLACPKHEGLVENDPVFHRTIHRISTDGPLSNLLDLGTS